jgi:nucleoside-diphosphate-sugar epimerase
MNRSNQIRPRPPIDPQDLIEIEEELASHLHFLRDKSILVTGGTGFFGRWLIESFLHLNKSFNLNSKLSVVSRDPESFLASAPQFTDQSCIDYIKGDIRDFEPPPQTFHYIIHAATDTSTNHGLQNPLELFDVIVDGTRRMLTLAKKAKTERFLYISSGAVYGPQPAEIPNVTEDCFFGFDANKKTSAYAEGKRAAEFLCSVFADESDMAIPIARCFAFVGPHLPIDEHFAIGNFIRDRLTGRQIQIQGDGKTQRSYLYASDLTTWLWTILLHGKSGRSYNVGSDNRISIADLATLISSPFCKPYFATPPSNPKEAQSFYTPSTHRSKHELGLKIKVDLEESIRRTIKWYELNEINRN